MTRVRHAAMAGRFYPSDANELESMVRSYVEVDVNCPEVSSPKAIIAPHAGYVYSGPIAGSAYRYLARDRDVIRRVVLLGPAHRLAFAGLATVSADAFATPLGTIPIDRAAVEAVGGMPQVVTLDRAHDLEHSLEVHLPFLQVVLDTFTLVPFAVGDADARDVADVLDALWGGAETRFVISSDLSHYHDYATARRMDAATTRAIESLDDAAIGYDDACGRNGINGLLVAARGRHLRATAVDVRSSGDTAGSTDSVVGYGAYVFA